MSQRGKVARPKQGAGPAAPAGLEARRVAVGLIGAVLRNRTPLDEALARSGPASGLARLEPRDRAFARAIASTSLRRLGQIEAVIATFVAKPPPEDAGPVREILIASAAQLLFLATPPHAAVALGVELARRHARARRFDKLLNAVLRRIAEQGPALIASQDAARLNTPDWLWRSWVEAYGESTARQIAEAHLGEAALDLSVRAEPDRWAAALGAVTLTTGSLRLATHGRIDALPGFAEGAWWVQDAAAAIPARLLGDVAGRRVLDLCAAPGGKTAELAAAGARVTALDVSGARLERLNANLARLHLEAEVVEADALKWEPPSRFDAVLLDAPCTATGTVRRHPDVLRLKGPEDVATMAALQERLLERSLGFVESGGLLVYCTCSLQPEEGPLQIERVLQAELPAGRKLRVVPIMAGEAGIEAQWITPEGFLRTLPCHLPRPEPGLSGLDGFFAARLVVD